MTSVRIKHPPFLSGSDRLEVYIDVPEPTLGYPCDDPPPPPTQPTFTATRDQLNALVVEWLRGPEGPVGPMGAQGVSGLSA